MTEHLWYFGYGSNMSRAIFLDPVTNVRQGRVEIQVYATLAGPFVPRAAWLMAYGDE